MSTGEGSSDEHGNARVLERRLGLGRAAAVARPGGGAVDADGGGHALADGLQGAADARPEARPAGAARRAGFEGRGEAPDRGRRRAL